MLVEFALVFPLLVFLLFGIFGAGKVLNTKLSVTQAAREGARYGATVPAGQCTPRTGFTVPCPDPANSSTNLTWAQLVQAVTVERSAGAVTTADVCVALVKSSTPGGAPVAVDASATTAGGTSACYNDASMDTGQRVQVVVNKGTKIEAAVLTVPVTLKAQGLTKFEGISQ